MLSVAFKVDFFGRAGDAATISILAELSREEILDRVVILQLGCSLERMSPAYVKDLDKVACVDCNAPSFSICLVQRLSDATVVIIEEPTILHELDRSVFNDRATLRSVIHHCHLDRFSNVSKCDCRVDRVVIG